MILFNVQNVTLNLGGKPLLQNASFAIESGERVCLTGRNGAGKSSLLAILSGELAPDTGTVIRAGTPVGAMPQDVPLSWQGSVFNIVAEGLGANGAALNAAHAIAASGGKEISHTNMAEQSGWEQYGEILGVIKQLGLDPDADFSSLSGGTKRRVALARALVCSEDLILDEPTNHLDIATVVWLEDYLLRRARTLIFVSHDRSFATRLATRVIEVDRGGVYSYNCTYNKYPERRETRLYNEEQENALFDKKLAQEEVWIRQGIKARRTRNMGRVRALEAMRKEKAERCTRTGNVSMLAQEAEKSGKLVIEAKNISFAYEGYPPLFTDFSTIIQRGDRIGLIGKNGSGKSTLLRVLLGELKATAGSVRLGTNLQISYFDQLRMALDPEKSLMHNVADGNDVVTVGGATRHVAGYLQDFLFTADRLRLPVKALSGGERNRLLLAKLFTRPSNLLVLDEPTNDLDIETLELLEELIADYSGTVLLVSHDRQFLDNLVTSTIAFNEDGSVQEYVGAYTDWLRQRPQLKEKNAKNTGAGSAQGGANGQQSSNATEQQNSTTAGNANSQQAAKARKRTFNEQREFEQLEHALKDIPAKIEALEAEQAELEQRMADPAFFSSDPEAFNAAAARLEAIGNEQLELMEEWEQAEQRHAELASLAG